MSLRAGRLEQAALRLSNVDLGRQQRVVAMRRAMRSSVKCSMWDVPTGINDMKKGYQPRTRIVKDEKGDLVADSHSIMVRWRNYFSQIFTVHGVNDVRQAEIHTAEPLVPEPSAFEFEMAVEKPQRQVLIKSQQN